MDQRPAAGGPAATERQAVTFAESDPVVSPATETGP
jgi:hypothetical protein